MSVRVHLDNPHAFYTNLDFLSGKIILNLMSDETISAIVVKLEGESRTLLMRPPEAQITRRQARRNEQNQIAAESHKILYKIQTVFPSITGPGPASGASFTLRAGQHEYPFRFKIPFNNTCGDKDMQNIGVGLSGRLGLFELPPNFTHVRKTLPPSLSGFPGEAEIKYYVKVTVQRPSIWKENRRSMVGFKFLPIEPPRPPSSNAEAFARREHTFTANGYANAKKRGLFARQPRPLSTLAPSVLVDARLPSPSILVCRESLPLRVIIKKLNASQEYLFLVGLQVNLIGTTQVRAQEILRNELSTFPILSLQGLTRPVGEPSDKIGTETLLDDTLWDHVPLPPTVTPSFHICNLTRTYELEVRVVLGFGYPGDIQPQTQVIPLRFPVEVYSGIAPPPALLNAIAVRTPAVPAIPPRPGVASVSAPVPVAVAVPDPLYPPQMGTANADLDAPPSYEDAMADDIGPMNGHREYSGVTDENAPSDVGGEKGGGGAVPGYTAQSGSNY